MALASAQILRSKAQWRTLAHEQRRDLIVEVALDLLDRKGTDAITMRQVAQKLGLGAMTLYTYVRGQDELCRAIIKRGFSMLNSRCQKAGESLPESKNWQAGARTYIKFATENPALYHLMFSMPIKNEQADKDLITDGFAPLGECVREQMTLKGMAEAQIEKELPMAVARFWIALHGLASLAISGRLAAYDKNLDVYIDDLLERVAPT